MIFLLFISFLFAEIYSLSLFADEFGFLMTLLQVILSSMIGMFLMKYQWVFIFHDLVKNIGSQSDALSDSVVEILCFFVAGILLFIPGIITDTLALLLLFPVTRLLFFSLVKKYSKNILLRKRPFGYSNFSRQGDEEVQVKDVTPKK